MHSIETLNKVDFFALVYFDLDSTPASFGRARSHSICVDGCRFSSSITFETDGIRLALTAELGTTLDFRRKKVRFTVVVSKGSSGSVEVYKRSNVLWFFHNYYHTDIIIIIAVRDGFSLV